MLYDPNAFELLTDEPWDAHRVRSRVAAIDADADATFDEEDLWRPVEEWDPANGTAPLPLTTLYRGAAGVVWGLDVLRRRGVAETTLDLPAIARRALEIWRANPAPEHVEPPVRTRASLFDGDSGILLVAHRLAPDRDYADALFERVRKNWHSETNELMGGAPGTMLAAKAMLDWTGEERWAYEWRRSADELWRRRYLDGFWTYPPFGKRIGASHGIGTNTNILLAGGDLLPDERRDAERWLERARRFAVHALEQVERWRARRGRGRCSLWAGDIGAAVFAADCLDAPTAVPIVDYV